MNYVRTQNFRRRRNARELAAKENLREYVIIILPQNYTTSWERKHVYFTWYYFKVFNVLLPLYVLTLNLWNELRCIYVHMSTFCWKFCILTHYLLYFKYNWVYFLYLNNIEPVKCAHQTLPIHCGATVNVY